MNKRKLNIAILYVNKNSQNTNALLRFIAENVNAINRVMYIRIIKVTSRNKNEIKRKGITEVPALIYKGVLYTGVKDIVKIITPPKPRNNFGPKCEEEVINDFHQQILHDYNDDDTLGDELDSEEIRKRMAKLSERKPHCSENNTYQPPRRQIDTRPVQSDEDFIRRAQLDNVQSTPPQFAHEDGDMILAEYYAKVAKEGF